LRASLSGLSTPVLSSALTLLVSFVLGLSIPRSRAAQSENSVSNEVIRLERMQWDAFKRKDRAALAAILAKDYFDFGSDGREDRTFSLTKGYMADDQTLSEFTIEDPQVKLLDDHTALLTYRGTYRGTNHGKPDSGAAFYTDLYRKQGGRWLSVFTQDSNLKCADM
jgi:hypothetical protein